MKIIRDSKWRYSFLLIIPVIALLVFIRYEERWDVHNVIMKIKNENAALSVHKEIISLDQVFLILMNDDHHDTIVLEDCINQTEMGLFLPAYASLEHCYIGSLEGRYLLINDKKYGEGDSLNDLDIDQTYTMKLMDGQKELDSSQVIVMRSTNIPSVFITTESGSMDYIYAEKGNEESGYMSVVDADGTIEYSDKMKEIKGRGNYSWSSDWGAYKKPFRIKLDKKIQLFDGVSSKEWILVANGTRDDSYISNKMVYDVVKDMGMNYAPSADYVDLYLNGQYVGNYLVCTRKNIHNNKEVQDLDEENEEVNPFVDIPSLSQVDEHRVTALLMENNPEDITGGYLVEVQSTDTIGKFTTKMELPCSIRYPEYPSYEEAEYIEELFEGMENAFLSEDGYDEDSGKYYTDIIDLPSFVDKYLIEEISNNYDAGVGSSFYYKMQDDISHLIYVGPVWDFDGCFWATTEETTGIYTMTMRKNWFAWYSELYKFDDFQAAMKERFATGFRPAFQEMVDTRIDGYVDLIGSSVAMDKRWLSKENDFTQRTDKMKQYVSERINYLNDVWINDLYDEVAVCDEQLATRYLYAKDGESLELPVKELEGYEFLGYYDCNTGEEITGSSIVVHGDRKIIAKWKKQE